LVYTWRNPTLRGLGFSISTGNLGGGALTILVPLIVLQRLGMSETAVGMVFAAQGIAGMISAVVSGRINSEGRERPMLALPMIGMGLVLGVLLLKTSLLVLVFVLVISGLLTGPLDIALFTLRQRRTAQEWTGRAFAVSMSFNYLGMPIGAALAGLLASISIETAVAFTALTSLVGALLAWRLIPQNAAD
jgi:predicted MFS family arabinose efflux permease